MGSTLWDSPYRGLPVQAQYAVSIFKDIGTISRGTIHPAAKASELSLPLDPSTVKRG